MTLKLSKQALLLSKQTTVQQQLIVEIDGIDYIFGAVDVLKKARYGFDDLKYGQDDLYYGQNIPIPNQLPWISLDKTTKQITQQLLQDKGGTGSVSTMRISLVDKNNFLTELFTINEMLGRGVKIFFGYAKGAHPEDSIEIFSGIIDSLSFGSGNCLLNVSHPEQLKRQNIFLENITILTSDIDASTTTIPLQSSDNFLIAQDALTTYYKIEDEIIQYNPVVRGSLGTVATSHDSGIEVHNFYRLQGNAIDLSLKVMLSGSGYFESNEIGGFVVLNSELNVNNGIIFSNIDLKSKYGIVVGDLIKVEGSTNNDFIDREIEYIELLDNNDTYIIVNGSNINSEAGGSGTAYFKSQYDTLPKGARLGMTPKQVDIEEHLLQQSLYGASFHSYDFYIEETINGKEFIDQEIYFPSGLYQIPRKGRSSVGSTNPPLASANTTIIGFDDVINPSNLLITRGINKNFYNSVIYKYNVSPIDNSKFLRGSIVLDADSTNQISVGDRPLQILSKGIREGGDANIQRQSRRFLSRYRFGAESISCQVSYSKGVIIEVGDIVAFGDNDLQISDSTNNTRKFKQRLMEVINKKMDIISGKINISLLDTSFQTDGNFVTISPASYIDDGSSQSKIYLKKKLTNKGLERTKWTNYIGKKIQLRSQDFTSSVVVTLLGFDPIASNALLIDGSSVTPLEDWIAEPPNYNDGFNDWSNLHGSISPSFSIITNAANTQTTFEISDIDNNIYIDAKIYIHNNDYSELSDNVIVIDKVGNFITVNNPVGFIPTSSHTVEGAGFIVNKGNPYLIT